MNPEKNSSEGLEEVVGEEKPLHESKVNYSRIDKLILAYMAGCGFRLGTIPAEAVSDYLDEKNKIYLLLGTLIPVVVLSPFVPSLSWFSGYVDKYFTGTTDIKKRPAMTRDLVISGMLGMTLGAIYFYSK